MTRERPILFSAPMVCAILAGKKTQTRRIAANRGRLVSFDGTSARFVDEIPDDPVPATVRHRYGVCGDHLWVRETWASGYRDGCWGTLFAADASFVQGKRSHEKGPHFNANDNWAPIVKWRPSIFMPRWASRITLEVTNVRVERLHALTEEDARDEGVTSTHTGNYILNGERVTGAPLRHSFFVLWDKINGKRAPFSLNPWVWVVSFRRKP